MDRWLYTFPYGHRFVTFGPYANSTEASEAFQRAYGYWPAVFVDSRPYTR